MRKDFQEILANMAHVLHEVSAVNTIEEMRRHTQPGAESFGDYQIDLSDSWGAVDRLGIAWMGFFHDIPAPPPAGPCPDCPPAVTCGPGTFLQMDTCLPVPSECPAMLPDTFILDGVVNVRCVEAR